jgi:hypothetical protein
MADDDALDEELERVTGNRKMAEELKRNLTRLRDGVGGPALAEMARDLLDGRITFRDVTRSSAYADPLTNAMNTFREQHDQLSEDERAQLLAEAEERFRDNDGHDARP